MYICVYTVYIYIVLGESAFPDRHYKPTHMQLCQYLTVAASLCVGSSPDNPKTTWVKEIQIGPTLCLQTQGSPTVRQH